MILWVVVLVVGALTFLQRLSFLVLWERLRPPPALKAALRFVPIAVLSALVAPALVQPAGALDLSPDNHRLLAGLAAIVVAYYTGRVLPTLLVGFLVLLGLGLVG